MAKIGVFPLDSLKLVLFLLNSDTPFKRHLEHNRTYYSWEEYDVWGGRRKEEKEYIQYQCSQPVTIFWGNHTSFANL